MRRPFHLIEQLGGELPERRLIRAGSIGEHPGGFVFAEFVQERELLGCRADRDDPVAQGD